jgi:hypothetical protein
VKNALWLIAGIGIGFVAAHQVAQTPQGKRFFDSVNARAQGFSGAIVDGYREREQELRAVIADEN